MSLNEPAGKCENCTGPLKKDWLTKELFHAETGMKNCPFSKDVAKVFTEA